MGKKGKFGPSKRKMLAKKKPPNKRKQTDEPINKKAIFNRYRNKQRIEEELIKKRKLEDKFQHKHVSSESEEEPDSYQQLLGTFLSKAKKAKVAIDSESDSDEGSTEKAHTQEDNLSDESENSVLSSDDDLDDVEQEEEDLLKEDNEEFEKEEELEEEEDAEIDLEEDNKEKIDGTADIFTRHLQHDLDAPLLLAISNTPPTVETTRKTWPVLNNIIITIPKPISSKQDKQKKVTLLEEKIYALPGLVPKRINEIDFNTLCIKPQIQPNIVTANKTNLIKSDLEITDIFTPLQKELFSIINNYQDLYFPERTFSNSEQIRFAYCLHAVNHILKTRTKILHHNAKLAKKDDVPDEFRDQGLVRPKVLILVPFKDSAYKVIKTIIDILMPKEAGQVVNRSRFEEDFTGGEIAMPKKNPKPEDYELLFNGNTDDTFRLGMTLTKKTLKLYTDFYSSDIIVASPLGLRVIIGAEGEEEREYDFLASIELLVLDQADVFFMQNWDHLLHVLDHLHLQPKKTHGTDFSRIRSWAVNGWTKYYRQTLIFSSVSIPEINAIVNKKCINYAGKVRVSNPIQQGSIRQITLQVPQVFHRFNATDPLSAIDRRFEVLIKDILPGQRDPLMNHTMIYVPSYFDYVKIRNHFKKEDISFVQICEYSKEGKVARARDMFFHTEAHFLLYSERAHFFRRLRIKGVRHIVFYQPPTYPHFYSELCNLMQEANQNAYGGSELNMTVTCLYCKYDLQQLSAVLGAERAAGMAQADKHVHMYVTGE